MTKISTPAAPEGGDSPERTAALDRLDPEQLFADLKDAWDADSRLFFAWANLPAAVRDRFVAEVLGMVRRYPHAPSEGSLSAERDLFKAARKWIQSPAKDPDDYHRAMSDLIWRRADDGLPEAQFCVGAMCETDRPPNLVGAYVMYSLAAKLGIEGAAEGRDAVVLKMTPDQIAEAQRLAAEWQAAARH